MTENDERAAAIHCARVYLREARSEPRRLAYRASIFKSLCPVIFAICKSVRFVRSYSRAVASWRKSWKCSPSIPTARIALAHRYDTWFVAALAFW